MPRKSQRRKGASKPLQFEGLWLCPKTAPDEYGLTSRHALLFFTRDDALFFMRFNHDDVEGGMTVIFVYDYKVSAKFIHQHPVGYPESFRVSIPWRAEDDGSLTLAYGPSADRFYPATFDQLFSLGFERDEVEEALTDAKEAGWLHSVEPRFPEFAGTHTA